MVERISRHQRRFHQHHILLTVVDVFRRAHREVVVVEVFFVQQELTVLHQIHEHRLHRTACHLDTQRVACLLTEQPTTLDDGHTVTRRTTVIGCLIHILHTLGHVDIVLALHSRLTVEAFQQFGHLAVILRDLVDGDIHQFTGIIVLDNNLAQLDRRRLQTDFQTFRLAFLQRQALRLISQMGDVHGLRHLVQLQREVTVFVRHHGNTTG